MKLNKIKVDFPVLHNFLWTCKLTLSFPDPDSADYSLHNRLRHFDISVLKIFAFFSFKYH